MKVNLNNIQDVFKAKRCDVETMKLKGYELVENMFVDNSGWGAENEPAYTANQFISHLTQLIKDNGELYAFITDVGQFQVYLGVFKKTNKRICKKIANNTYEYEKDGARYIRLHATDILKFDGDKITLNSGGYRTLTTKRRINQYLSGAFVYQKDYTWYIKQGEKTIKFEDGITINN